MRSNNLGLILFLLLMSLIGNLLNGFTLGDIKEFNHKFIQNKPKTYMILATEGEVDLDAVGDKFGTVVKLTLEDIFGY